MTECVHICTGRCQVLSVSRDAASDFREQNEHSIVVYLAPLSAVESRLRPVLGGRLLLFQLSCHGFFLVLPPSVVPVHVVNQLRNVDQCCKVSEAQ